MSHEHIQKQLTGEVTERDKRRRAYMVLSYELLAKLLKFPEGTRILEVARPAWSEPHDTFAIYVEHPDLPAIHGSMTLPQINPKYETETVVVTGDRVIAEKVTFKDWGET